MIYDIVYNTINDVLYIADLSDVIISVLKLQQSRKVEELKKMISSYSKNAKSAKGYKKNPNTTYGNDFSLRAFIWLKAKWCRKAK